MNQCYSIAIVQYKKPTIKKHKNVNPKATPSTFIQREERKASAWQRLAERFKKRDLSWDARDADVVTTRRAHCRLDAKKNTCILVHPHKCIARPRVPVTFSFWFCFSSDKRLEEEAVYNLGLPPLEQVGGWVSRHTGEHATGLLSGNGT